MSSSSTSTRRVALVTGASRGIGRGIAIELGRVGFDVLINYRANAAEAERARELVETVATEGARAGIFAADVSNAGDRARLVAHTKDLFGRVDLLVNNAGIAPERRVDLLQTSEESFDHLMDVNLKGPFFLSQLVANWMIEQKNSDVSTDYTPSIVNVGSVSAYAASPERAEYCMSKAGLAMMTKLFAVRLAAEGINVYEVRPGVITTDMTANVKEKYDKQIADGLTPITRWGTPEDVGRAVAAIAVGNLPFSTGEVINVDGGFHLRRL